jgi:pimeloyl-ACP methyl ester carboxylesterase
VEAWVVLFCGKSCAFALGPRIAILISCRAYTALFSSKPFTHMVFVDQSPLQNVSMSPPWNHPFCNKGMNNSAAVASLQTTLALTPELAYRGTISACLSYLSHPPAESSSILEAKKTEDIGFFLKEAKKGNAEWFGQLMADHTALDHRANITATLGPGSKSPTKILVIASSRSGCFWPDGPMSVVDLVNGSEETSISRAKGIVVDWGGHWCFWEDPDKFNQLCLEFLAE